eukprot:Gb_38046 [translate_table: standard]
MKTTTMMRKMEQKKNATTKRLDNVESREDQRQPQLIQTAVTVRFLNEVLLQEWLTHGELNNWTIESPRLKGQERSPRMLKERGRTSKQREQKKHNRAEEQRWNEDLYPLQKEANFESLLVKMRKSPCKSVYLK